MGWGWVMVWDMSRLLWDVSEVRSPGWDKPTKSESAKLGEPVPLRMDWQRGEVRVKMVYQEVLFLEIGFLPDKLLYTFSLHKLFIPI